MPPDHDPTLPGSERRADPEAPAEVEHHAPVVDFPRAARRLRASALVLGALAVGGWLLVGLLRGGPDPADLGAWVGLALFGMFLVELVVVGGSALRGMLRAGDRGERLAGGDVGILPPQLTGRSPRRHADP